MEKRKRGAPVGNRNAVKHGFYCKKLNRAEKTQFKIAEDIEGISQEIALLRFEIQKAVATGELANLIPLSKAAYALEKLVRTQHKIFGSRNNLQDALAGALRDTLVPLLGPDGAASFLHWKYRYQAVPQETIEEIKKQYPAVNEADFTVSEKQIPESV